MRYPLILRLWGVRVGWVMYDDPPETSTVTAEVIRPPRAAINAGPASLPPAGRAAAEPAWWCHVCMRTVPVSEVPAHQHDR